MNILPYPDPRGLLGGAMRPTGYGDQRPQVPELDYCGCCGGLASEPPKGEHGRCCAGLHDRPAEPSITPARATLMAHRVESDLCCTVYDVQCICLPGCRCNCRDADGRAVCSCPKPSGSC